MDLSGNTLLITGASSGIGRALSEAFLRSQNQVIGVGRNQAALEEISMKYPNFHGIKADLAEEEGLKRIVAIVQRDYPNINVLINNAGIQHQYSWLQAQDAWSKIDQELSINLVAPLKLTASLVPVLQKNPNPMVVNISSALAIVPKQSAPVYCASKAGLHIFSKALRYQLEKKGIRVMEVLPPLVDTPMTEGRHKGEVTPESLAKDFMNAFQRNQQELNVGKTKLLRTLKRLAPRIADNILKNS